MPVEQTQSGAGPAATAGGIGGRPRPAGTDRAGLAARTALMAAQIFLVVTAFTLTKALRDAVFLSHFRTHELAYVSLVLAGLAGLAAAAHARLVAARFSRGMASAVTLLIVAASLVAMTPWMNTSARWIPWVLYLWSGVFGLFLVAQFWSMALEVFDPREVRRVLGVLAAGASLGGVAGGVAARALGASLDDRTLLLVVAGILVAAAALARVVWSIRPRAGSGHPSGARGAVFRPSVPAPAGGAIGAIRGSALLQSTAALLLCSIVAGTLLDFQIKAVVKAHYASDRVAMTQFFGQLLAVSSAAALALQTLTTPLLRRLGVASALLALPATLVLVSALLVFQPVVGLPLLSVVVLARTAENGVRNSIDKAAVELLYLPLPAATRASGKGLVDTVADRLGGAIAAFLWLAMQQLADVERPERTRIASFVVAAVCVVWMVVAVRGRRHHLGAFRETLARMELHPEQILVPTDGDAQRDALAAAVESPDPSTVRLALEVLADRRNAGVPVDVAPLVAHADPVVRAAAVETLVVRRDRSAARTLGAAFTDPDPRVRIAAVRWLAAVGPSVAPVVQGGESVASAAGAPVDVRRAEMAAHLASSDPARRVLGGLVAVDIDDRATLATLLADPDPAVAAGVLDVVTQRGARNALPVLLAASDRPGMYAAVVSALPRAVPAKQLGVALLASDTPVQHRRIVAAALGRTAQRDAIGPLVTAYSGGDAPTRAVALRSLTQLRRECNRGPARAWLDAMVLREIGRLAEFASLAERVEHHAASGLTPVHGQLLGRALREAQDTQLGDVFALLALGPSPKPLRDAWLSLRDGGSHGRATAIEYLDNALPAKTRALVMPLIEAESTPARWRALLSHRRSLAPHALADVFERLAHTDDAWLSALGRGLAARVPSAVEPAHARHDASWSSGLMPGVAT